MSGGDVRKHEAKGSSDIFDLGIYLNFLGKGDTRKLLLKLL